MSSKRFFDRASECLEPFVDSYWAKITRDAQYQQEVVSAGRLDLVVMGMSFYPNDLAPPAVKYNLVDGQNW